MFSSKFVLIFYVVENLQIVFVILKIYRSNIKKNYYKNLRITLSTKLESENWKI